MFGKFKVASLIGSTKDRETEFRHVEKELTKLGYICFAPAIYNYEEYLTVADIVNDMCYAKLMVCDICVIVNPQRIGKSTKSRIEQAENLNIPVYKWENESLVEYRKSVIEVYK